jgi:hypothetical protein
LVQKGLVGIQEDIPCMAGDALVTKSLKDKCISMEVKFMIGNLED